MLVGYARCSLSEERQSIDLQLDALEAAGVDRRHIFTDRGSGAKFDRPGLRRMLEFVDQGDSVLCFKLDRIGRSTVEVIRTADTLRKKGVGLKSLTENIDTDSPAGQMMFTLLAAFAQMERELVVERVRAGLDAAARRGRRGGRPRRMSEEAIKAATSLLHQGNNVSEVARALNVPRSTLVDAMNRGEAAIERAVE